MWDALESLEKSKKGQSKENTKFQIKKMGPKAQRRYDLKIGIKKAPNDTHPLIHENMDDDEESIPIESDDEIDEDGDESDVSDDEAEDQMDESLPAAKKWKPNETNFTFNQIGVKVRPFAKLPAAPRDLKREIAVAEKNKALREKLEKTEGGADRLKRNKLELALKKVQGEKVKIDDPKLLKKDLKRKLKAKEKSKREWAERKKNLEEETKLRDETRKENLKTKRIRGTKEFIEKKKKLEGKTDEPTSGEKKIKGRLNPKFAKNQKGWEDNDSKGNFKGKGKTGDKKGGKSSGKSGKAPPKDLKRKRK